MLKLKNFLFDLDGVLVNACEWHFKTLNQALVESDFPEISYYDHIQKYNGLPSKIKLSLLEVPIDKQELIIQRKAFFLQEYIDKNCKKDEEKIELLEYLKSKKGKIACVTNSVRHTAFDILSKMEVIKYFDIIISNEDVEKNKPDPEPYNCAVDNLKISPEETLIVEDSINGFLAAAKSCVNLLWKVPEANYVNINNYRNIFEGADD